MANRQGLFESLQSEIVGENQDNNAGLSDESSDSDSSGEEFNYEFPDDDDLPEPCDCDEEYVLTELGPMAYHFQDDGNEIDDQESSTSAVDETSSTSLPTPTTDYIAKDGTNWSKEPPTVQKTPAKNVFRPPKTVLRYCESVLTPYSAFRLFFTDSMVADIVKYTNKEGTRADKEKWLPTDSTEILALIGCLIHLGAKNMNMFPLKLVFDPKSGETIVRCAFTINRFSKLCNRLRFDDKSSRNQRWHPVAWPMRRNSA